MEKYLTVSTVAEMFDVTPYTVRGWLKENKLRGFKVNGNWRIKESDAEAFAKQMFGEANA